MRRSLVAVVLLCCLIVGRPAMAQSLSVFAAASLTDAMRDVDAAWQAAGHPKLSLNFAASSTLARQIEQGAAANVFASADAQWMDWADQRNLLAPGTRKTLLGNALVLVEPKDTMRPVTIGPGWNLLALLGPGGRLAVGDPSNVPAGIYAQQALTKLGLWKDVQPRLASSDSVRSALLLVQRGEVPAGIVYATDAAVAPGVAVAGTFPESTHDPVIYPFAITRTGDTPEARALMAFLAGPRAAALFAHRGFQTR
jgi:molybdate transport system substrate-binding protein